MQDVLRFLGPIGPYLVQVLAIPLSSNKNVSSRCRLDVNPSLHHLLSVHDAFPALFAPNALDVSSTPRLLSPMFTTTALYATAAIVTRTGSLFYKQRNPCDADP